MTPWLLCLFLFAPAAVPEIGRESGALPAAVLATPGARRAADATTQRVAVWVEVDGPSLAGSRGDSAGEPPPESVRAELHVYAMTASGELAGSLGRRLRLPVAELLQGRVKLATYLDLAPGEYRLHVLVRELRSQRFALRLVPLTVAPSAGSPAAGSPVRRPPPALEGAASPRNAGIFAWNALQRSPDGEEKRQAVELSGRRRTSKRIRAVAEAYRGVLDRLASGLLDEAAVGLRELESEVLHSHDQPYQAWSWLVAAQDQVIGELAEAAP